MAGSNADGPGQLPPELLANIHDRLEFLDRIAFATVFAAYIDDDTVLSPAAPWLLFPCEKDKDPTTATLFSVADRRAATVRAPYPALRGHLVLGSSHGWLATADNQGQMYVVNPATGEQRALPDITTMGVFTYCDGWFSVWIERFLTAQFGGGPPFGDNCWGPEGQGTIMYPADEMRLRFYRKVVLAIGRRPGSHAAMLLLSRGFAAPAFATAEDGAAWRLAQSRDGVEDAIYHDGRFHSVTYSGVVEAWERDAESGAYTSTAVSPPLTTVGIEGSSCRKYLVAAPGGRLMVVVKYVKPKDGRIWSDKFTCSFKLHVLRYDGQWEETRDIGDAALFVGVNNSLCMPTMRCPEIEAGCVYYADDQLWELALRKRNRDLSYRSYDEDEDEDEEDEEDDGVDIRPVGVYSLKDGTLKKVEGLGRQQYRCFSSTPPVWITPSIP